MSQILYDGYWEATDASMMLDDVSINDTYSPYPLSLGLRAPNLAIQVDASAVVGYYYLEESLTGSNYHPMADSSVEFNPTVTSYYNEWRDLLPTTIVRMRFPYQEDVSALGHYDLITMRNIL